MAGSSGAVAHGGAPGARAGMLGYISNNIRAGGNSPSLVLGGFVAAWALLFLFLFVIPLPEIMNEDGTVTALGVQGRACLAVMVWACTIWLSEAIPIAMTGLM
ncbi:MAG: hypothetical protein AB7D51_13475, partial [Desulfovibrionaceae bacterium]